MIQDKKRVDVLIFRSGISGDRADIQYPSHAFPKIQHYAFNEHGHLMFIAEDGTELVTNMDFIISFPTDASIEAERQYAQDQALKHHINDKKIILSN